MSISLEVQYLNLLSPRLRNFKEKQGQLWNFSCPLCGDSKKNASKARGFVFRKGGSLVFKCHNCGESMSFVAMLQKTDPQMYDEFMTEKFRAGSNKGARVRKLQKQRDEQVQQKMGKAPNFNKKAPSEDAHARMRACTRVSALPHTHACARYVRAREIPEKHLNNLYYTDDFGQVALDFDSKKYQKLGEIEKAKERLIIPFFDFQGNLTMIQGRALESTDPKFKYMTLKMDGDNPKVFGLERVDMKKRVYVTEGPIDSLFLPNAVATADANLASFPENFEPHDCVLVFDNEPRNKQLIQQMKEAQKKGHKVCIWDARKEKDINSMILAGYNADSIREYIDEHSYSGMELELELSEWRKIANV